jgi:hypothetical protein
MHWSASAADESLSKRQGTAFDGPRSRTKCACNCSGRGPSRALLNLFSFRTMALRESAFRPAQHLGLRQPL